LLSESKYDNMDTTNNTTSASEMLESNNTKTTDESKLHSNFQFAKQIWESLGISRIENVKVIHCSQVTITSTHFISIVRY
jgi:hypothetical protein